MCQILKIDFNNIYHMKYELLKDAETSGCRDFLNPT